MTTPTLDVSALVAEARDWPGAQTGDALSAAHVSSLLRNLADALEATNARAGEGPIPMVLHCPACGLQHIDAPDPEGLEVLTGKPRWMNPPHRSHRCLEIGCGHIWRPDDVPTEGVAAIQTRGGAPEPEVVERLRNAFHRTRLTRDLMVPADDVAEILSLLTPTPEQR